VPLPGALDSHALELFERYLQEFLAERGRREPVASQIAYHFGLDAPHGARHGKRLRPRLVMAAAAAYGARPERTLHACTAIELLHNYSLVHDDIEDGDELRHGRRTLWATYGLPHGVNGGDAIGALAHLALASAAQTHGVEVAFEMSMDLARANLRMCEGQSLDLALESGAKATTDIYLEMIEGKTAALFGCAGALGARCASAADDEVERSREIGRLFGLGFQIRDDVLGIWGSTESTGKVAAGDIARRKKTFPVIWAMEHDPSGAGSAVLEVYGSAASPTRAQVERLRTLLEESGAYRAASAAADNYLASALSRAQGSKALGDFIMQNRT
jgi:geranylgeranyl diphosphate synthase, type I